MNKNVGCFSLRGRRGEKEKKWEVILIYGTELMMGMREGVCAERCVGHVWAGVVISQSLDIQNSQVFGKWEGKIRKGGITKAHVID